MVFWLQLLILLEERTLQVEFYEVEASFGQALFMANLKPILKKSSPMLWFALILSAPMLQQRPEFLWIKSFPLSVSQLIMKQRECDLIKKLIFSVLPRRK